MTGTLLSVEDLRVGFRTSAGRLQAVDGLTYTLDAGETLAVVGESGSGKSVSAHAVLGILPPPADVAGTVRFDGQDLLRLGAEQRRKVRGAQIAMIFQDALSALHPLYPVGWQIGEMFVEHRGLSMDEGRKRAVDLLDQVQIPDARRRADDYPHQFSGGMRQRVMIAMAIALGPKVLIADEPTTALDVTVQAQILRMLGDLRREHEMALLLITHDLGVVANVADRVAVMYAGRIVEHAPVLRLYDRPAHPYTRALLDSIPRRSQRGGRLQAITGQPPDLTAVPAGCPFHPRCPLAVDVCRTGAPPEPQPAGDGHTSACHRWTEVTR
jgi:oligopeptide transport system ATP-binding protein